MRLICSVMIGLSASVLSAQSVDEDQARIERAFGHSFADVVRLNYWSVFERGDEFAEELGISRVRLDTLLAKHAWQLEPPPALSLQNSLDSDLARSLKEVKTSSNQGAETGAFIEQSGELASRETFAEIRCDSHKITLTVTCADPDADQLKAVTPLIDNRPAKVRAFWDGDFAAIKPLLYQGMSLAEETQWALGLSKPDQSVLLDECVVVCLTPVGVGQDWSNFDLIEIASDPEELRSQLKPRPANENRVFMEGAYYFIAVNPAGVLLDVFYDPWDGGTMCPAWKSEAKVTTTRSELGWKLTMEVPWDSLRPTVEKGSVWGIDVSRIHRRNTGPAELSRSAETTLVLCDVDRNTNSLSIARGQADGGTVEARRPTLRLATVDSIDWDRATTVSKMTDRSGRSSDRTQARLMHDHSNLHIRFDCEEPSLNHLGVVTREEEDRTYGSGNRRTNYLDRRESWGIEWGDYVEVLLSPELAATDSYHAGVFQFLVNSDGVVLQRYYDSFGMFTVMPYPEWQSGAAAKVEKHTDGKRWSVELSIPFSALCEPGLIPKRWGLNLHRCVSGKNAMATDAAWMWKDDSKGQVSRRDALDLFWSVPDKLIRDPSRLGWLEMDPSKISPLAKGGTRPGPAPGRVAKQGESGSLERDRRGDRLGSVDFVDATHGWAAGGLGTILHTRDGGVTWEEQDSGVNVLLEKVHFVDREHGWAVGGWPRDYDLAIFGGMGVILATDDGGRTWKIQLDSVGGWLSGLTFLDRKNGWAVGEFGTGWRTTDGGEHWNQMRNVPTPGWLYDVHFIDRQHGWTVGRFETVLTTEDGGESWKTHPMPALHRPFGLSLSYRAVRFSSPFEGWIVGQHGNILHTNDGGKTWAREDIQLDPQLLDLVNLDDISLEGENQVWAVSPFALLRRDPASGTWSVVRTGTPGWWRSVHFSDELHGWLSGDRGTVIHTTDGGKSWTKQRSSERRMGVLYASPHDHHINGSAMAAVGDDFDSAYLLLGRTASWLFQTGGDVNTHKTDAVTAALGVTVGYNFNEFAWRGRDSPHLILERYQHHRGLKAIELRLVAAIRCLGPSIIVGEQPVMQEGYYAHGVGDVARAVVAAFESAGDADRFPELAELGLEPHTPQKLYLATMWPNQMYNVHPMTLRLAPQFGEDKRLGRLRREVALTGRQVFWGLLDRGRPPETQKPWPGAWSLHLKKSRVGPASFRNDLFEGVR